MEGTSLRAVYASLFVGLIGSVFFHSQVVLAQGGIVIEMPDKLPEKRPQIAQYMRSKLLAKDAPI